MPEGPEIRLAADKLNAILEDELIEAADFTLPGMHSANNIIPGKRVKRVTCHGKAMLTQFDHGETLYSHNQLYGVWRTTKRGKEPSTNRQLRVALHTKTHSAWLYSATDVEFWPTDQLDQHPFLRKLGPDVLDERLTKAMLVERLCDQKFSRRSLASLYLDQSFLAGIGNYLRSEILFHARVSPTARPIDLDKQQIRRLAASSITISQRSYRTKGITVTAKQAKQLAQTGSGFESYRFAVFGRKSKPCIACDAKILKKDITARRLYWCPTCQTK